MRRLAFLALVWLTLVEQVILYAQVDAAKQGNLAAAVSPSIPSTDAIREGEILILRTAGQPERHVQVMRISSIPDGPTVVDVKDRVSGTTYTLPLAAFAGARRGSSMLPGTSADAYPQTISGSVVMKDKTVQSPARSSEATTRETPAMPAESTLSAANPHPPAAFQRYPFPANQPAAARPQLTHQRVQPWPQMLPGRGTSDVSRQAPVGNGVVVPVTPRLSQQPAATAKTESLGVTNDAITDRSECIAELPAIERLRHTINAAGQATRATATTTNAGDSPVASATVASRSSEATVAVGVPRSQKHAEWGSLAFQRLSSAQMAAEVAPYIQELQNALRPSQREFAATALAEGRYGSRPEVKAVLAQAAMTDPAPSVRAHCITLLSSLGYHERKYLDFLRAAASTEVAQVKSAAVTALARLTPR